MCSAPFYRLLDRLNVSSTDNGREFVDLKRHDAIISLLSKSAYQTHYNKGVALIYANKALPSKSGLILISNHIDSRYKKHFYRNYNARELIGTFDNSLCNAIITQYMLSEAFQPNILIAFTGDEEKMFRGADESVEFFRNENLLDRLEMVITCDITSEGFSDKSFVVENYFVRRKSPRGSELRFKSELAIKQYIKAILDDNNPLFIRAEDGSADESWEYDEYDLNCFSFCIPCAPYPSLRKKKETVWMHGAKGIIVKKEAINPFAQALLHMCNRVAKDVLNWG